MRFRKVLLYYNTLKYLRRKQIAYRLWYFLRSCWRKVTGFSYRFEKDTPLSINDVINDVRETFKVSLTLGIAAPTSFLGKKEFTFLNKSQFFTSEIDWEFGDYGKLWTYNLTYFDFLNQKENEKQVTLRQRDRRKYQRR